MELNSIKGLSSKRVQELNKIGIRSAEELVRFFPRNYLDLRQTLSLKYAVHNDFILTKARIVAIPEFMPYARKKVKYFRAFCEQDGEAFTIIWFNQQYLIDKLNIGKEYLFFGRVRNRFGKVSLTNPTFELYDKNYYLKGIIPVYSQKSGVPQKVLRSAIIDGLNKLSFNSLIPEKLQKKAGLESLKKSFEIVHNPESFDELYKASDRIAIEEYFLLISAFKIIKGDKMKARVNRYTANAADIVEFVKRFDFTFTDGQKKAVNEIFADLKSPVVMNRLLQGDVGCGKTAVALCSVYFATKSGFQVAMIAPTEVLARQNYELIKKYFPQNNVGFLSGSLTQKEKTDIKSKLSSGEIDIAVGTHALLEKSITFKNLSLCICDEQQRFGVSQRSEFVEKGVFPDVLIMSATPIPRTLSLIFYGDLDISIITDKPVSRTAVTTGIVPKCKYIDMLLFIKNEFLSGRQAYFVCPKIEGDDVGSLISVKELFNELKKRLPSATLALLHGKMKDKEKTAVMQDFKSGKINGLVSTTVIEVGVDVPNATVMVIYGADRFGLSQLHQLRGRVGRSNLKSYCFLINDSESEKSIQRLNILKQNSDGFKISEKDFEERGGGDFLGTRQSGRFMSELGDLKYSAQAIFTAKKLSDEAFESSENIVLLREIALKKYDSLKDVILN